MGTIYSLGEEKVISVTAIPFVSDKMSRTLQVLQIILNIFSTCFDLSIAESKPNGEYHGVATGTNIG